MIVITVVRVLQDRGERMARTYGMIDTLITAGTRVQYNSVAINVTGLKSL